MASVFQSQRPPQSRSPQPRPSRHWQKWVFLGVAGLIGYFWLVDASRQRTFDEGIQAYEAADCAAAIAKFDHVIGDDLASSDPDDLGARAQAKKVECQTFQTVKAGKSATTKLANAAQFVQKYPDSQLTVPLRQAIAPAVQKASAKTLATPSTCQRLTVIETKDLIANPQIPALYQACGEVFSATKKLPQAIALYEKFLDQYPNHPLTDNIKQAYAKAIVRDAKAQGGGTISAPGMTGRTVDGSTVVSIRNDSTEAMRIVFSGPTPRVEELPACKDCQDFTPSSIPKSCPNKGQMGTYTVQPGDYEVMVKSTGNRSVKPFTGNWALDGGSEYSHCFYIVKDLPN
ncbi:MAG: tetratricopeptide repeat protein [Leptolyngbyaceae cyanobacterium bins.349]|nr:tetratricopeptide repeat protein [Leptolyngbyaceae cyanobacterium bins.349]